MEAVLISSEKKYKKGKGGEGQKGFDFQVNILALFALEGLHTNTEFELSTENKDCDKFDDVVYQKSEGDVLMQCKHKEKDVISENDIFSLSRNGDFSFAKYFISYLKLARKFTNALYFVCTNTNIKISKYLVEQNENTILSVGKCYKLKLIITKLQTCIEEYAKHVNYSDIPLDIAEKIPEFVDKFHYISIDDQSLFQHITNLMKNLGEEFKMDFSTQHFIQEMNRWFMEPKGIYLKKSHVKAFLFEYVNQKYAEKLKSCKIQFDPLNLPDSQILHVTVGDDIYLKMARLYQELLFKYNQDNILIMEPIKNDSGSFIMMKLLDIFALSRYILLIIVANELTDDQFNEITDYIKNLQKRFTFKKVFFFSKQFSHHEDVTEMNFTVNFNDLEDSSKQAFLQADCKFQGNKIKTSALLDSAPDTANEVFDDIQLVKFAANEQIEIEPVVIDFLGITPLYIERDLIYETEAIPEGKLALDIANGERKFILISDIAGMGKSTILTRLHNLAEQNTNDFVLRINLNLHTGTLAEFNKSKNTFLKLEDFIKIPINTFQEKLFQLRHKIILMVDAVDEISPEYTEIVLTFLNATLKRDNIKTLVVTTRLHLKNRLEKLFETKALGLKPLSEKDQVRLLCNFWKTSLQLESDDIKKCTECAKVLLKNLYQSIDSQNWSLTSIPLQTIMIADIFKTWCKESIESEQEVSFVKKIDMGLLYSTFLDKKRKIFIEDKCNTQGNTITEGLCNKEFDISLRMHQKLALNELVDEKKCQLFRVYRDITMTKIAYENIMKIGILHKLQDKIIFIHQTFAEYFVALSITNELINGNNSEEFISYVLEKIFAAEECVIIRCFLEYLLKDAKLPENIFSAFRHAIRDMAFSDKIINFKCLSEEGCFQTLKIIFEKNSFSKVVLEVRDKFERTAIHHAVEHLPVVEFLVGLEIDVNKEDNLGRTALHLAAVKNQVEVVKFLLANKADIGATDNFGNSLLHFASVVDSVELAQISLKNGTDLNANNFDSWTALHTAALHNSIHVIRILVKNGCNLNKKTNRRQTALHFATVSNENDESKTLATTQYLVSLGADTNVRDCYGRTALFPAMSHHSPAVAQFLVDQGCDINVADNNGVTLLHCAAEEDSLKLVKYLIGKNVDIQRRDNTGRTALHYAAKNDSIHVVEFLVDQGIDINVSDNNGVTILHVVAKSRSIEMINFLIDKKCNIHKRDNQGQTLIHFAILGSGTVDLVKFIVERGCNIHYKDNEGVTVLHRAAEKGSIEIIEYLFGEKGMTDCRDDNGKSVLHYAISTRNSLKLIKFLFECGCNVNAKDNNGVSPLHLATEKGRFDIVEYLITQGALVNARNYEGENALHSAFSSSNHVDLHLVKFLIDHGCDAEAKDNRGCTLLHRAAKRGALEITRYLIDVKGVQDSRDQNGKNVLFYAIRSNKKDILQFLIGRGFDVSVTDQEGRSLIHTAAEFDSCDTVHYLWKKRLNLNTTDSNGRTALHVAILNDSIRVAKILISLGVITYIRDNFNETPLDIAIRNGSQIVPYLISHKTYPQQYK
nr:uncharacterized protein LOC111513938 [Leptinotarsa decemlineata]